MTEKPMFSLLKGLPVREIVSDDEGVSIIFRSEEWPNGASVRIYGEADFQPVNVKPNDIVGRRLVDIRRHEVSIVLCFEDGVEVHVDMREMSYQGPERIQIRLPNGQIIVE